MKRVLTPAPLHIQVEVPSAAEWDDVIYSAALELRALARANPELGIVARQIAHSLQELIGMQGSVSSDYAQSLLGRAQRLLHSAEVLERETHKPAAHWRDEEDEDEREEVTHPSTPSALTRRPASGTRPLAADATRAHGLRLKVS